MMVLYVEVAVPWMATDAGVSEATIRKWLREGRVQGAERHYFGWRATVIEWVQFVETLPDAPRPYTAGSRVVPKPPPP